MYAILIGCAYLMLYSVPGINQETKVELISRRCLELAQPYQADWRNSREDLVYLTNAFRLSSKVILVTACLT